MKLQRLLNDVEILSDVENYNFDISHIAYDSREVSEGSLFVAIVGEVTDGHKYIESSVKKGASCIICEKAPIGIDIPYILVKNTRKALAIISKNFFENVCDKMKIIGITGTNGKTTTTYLVKHILEKRGEKVGLIGTNQNMIGDEIIKTERTTPESYELHKLFYDMYKAGCNYIVMEVSSHSLTLDRVYGIEFEVGAFTNLSQDHLDFHKTMENYRAAKGLLFEHSKHSVINYDDEAFPELKTHVKGVLYSYSAKKDSADFSARQINYKSSGVHYMCLTDDELCRVHVNIPGEFSVYNSLCAMCICHCVGIPIHDCAYALENASGVKGRAEVVPVPTEYTVLIDYAHSEDGIINILSAVKGFCTGRIISIFGCGGDRDKTKRPKMGKACASLSDLCIITSDNPRTEDPDSIISDILEGLKNVKCPYEVITDRRSAIKHALSIGKKDDILIFMGKGHETYQDINGIKHHLDEREEIAAYFEE